MEDKNKELQARVEAYRSDPQSENKQFSQVLQGTIDAAVQGGTNQYKKVRKYVTYHNKGTLCQPG